MKPPREVVAPLWRLFIFISEKESLGFLFFNLKSFNELSNSFFYLQSEQVNIFQKGGKSR